MPAQQSALRDAEALSELAQKHGMQINNTLATIYRGWAHCRLTGSAEALAEIRDVVATFSEQDNRLVVPFLQGLIAELEAECRNEQEAIILVDAALALAGETGEHWTDAFLHRIRGENLLKHDAVNTTPTEEAFLTAIAIAQQQKARSFELHAALSLAKLYQSTGRASDAYASLAPAPEGFSPTPEFPVTKRRKTLLAVPVQNGTGQRTMKTGEPAASPVE
jgi:predicted ATPase